MALLNPGLTLEQAPGEARAGLDMGRARVVALAQGMDLYRLGKDAQGPWWMDAASWTFVLQHALASLSQARQRQGAQGMSVPATGQLMLAIGPWNACDHWVQVRVRDELLAFAGPGAPQGIWTAGGWRVTVKPPREVQQIYVPRDLLSRALSAVDKKPLAGAPLF